MCVSKELIVCEFCCNYILSCSYVMPGMYQPRMVKVPEESDDGLPIVKVRKLSQISACEQDAYNFNCYSSCLTELII